MLCGIELGILIWEVVLVLHHKALETFISHVSNKNFFFIGGRQYFNEGLHAILLTSSSKYRCYPMKFFQIFFSIKSIQAPISRIFFVGKRTLFPLYLIIY